ncbi:MAG: substrate-binding domain-containing protein, partial [Gemmatimonadetes bacterium]|nr:substrate-binding domain-containing protein [Gemmatimonadota bacterium]
MPPLLVWGALVAAVAACGGAGEATGERAEQGRGNLRIVVVTHGQSADPFWSVVSNGAHDAAADMGIRVEYQAPGSFDMVEMSNIIEAVVASRPDGLVVSIPDADALEGSIRAAVNAGVPVLSINSGGDVYSGLGVLAHIGQSEYEAGLAAGEALAGAGVSMALCVNHEVGNVAQDLRCEGVSDALGVGGGRVDVLAVDLADPEDAVERILGALAIRSDVDGLVTLGPAAAGPALAAIEQGGREGEIAFGAFDL